LKHNSLIKGALTLANNCRKEKIMLTSQHHYAIAIVQSNGKEKPNEPDSE